MRPRAACLIVSVFCLTACEEKKEITVTESRAPTTRDAKPSPVIAETPSSWLALPASQIRLLNYRFGESGMGEVWVSVSGGSVLDNVNRWLGQFAAAPLDAAGLAALPTVSLAGAEGKMVTAAGEYAGGMGAPPKPGFGLAGVVAAVNGQILTVKMVGPKAEVETAKPTLESYIRSLRMAE